MGTPIGKINHDEPQKKNYDIEIGRHQGFEMKLGIKTPQGYAKVCREEYLRLNQDGNNGLLEKLANMTIATISAPILPNLYVAPHRKTLIIGYLANEVENFKDPDAPKELEEKIGKLKINDLFSDLEKNTLSYLHDEILKKDGGEK